MKLDFLIISALSCVLLGFITPLSFYEVISCGLLFYFLLQFLNSLGKSYNILYIPLLLAIFQCLIMPIFVYHIYNDNYLVRALKYSMRIPSDEYYGFMIPSVLAMAIGFFFPIGNSSEQKDTILKSAIRKIKHNRINNWKTGNILMIVGAISGFLQILIPGELRYVFYLLSKLIFIGIIYVYYSDNIYRNLYLVGGFSLIFLQSLLAGMFGDLIYTTLLTGILLLLNTRYTLRFKLIIVAIGMLFVLLIQSVKADYRTIAWYGKETESGATSFTGLLLDRLSKPEMFIDKWAMFNTVNRFNQGMIIARVMDYVPRKNEFTNGETIYMALFASFIPRFMWPDKPIAGGKEKIYYFTGERIVGYSMNIGPIGEAYGNFGKMGGVIFMFFYGFFFNWVFSKLVKRIRVQSGVILWLPILYLNSVQMETDVLGTVNALIKNIIFLAICLWAFPKLFNIKL